ncbi:MAG: SlyX family protein [Woeseiaceae bacterium]
MSALDEQRLIEIETRLAHQEKLLTELDQALVEQQALITRLEQHCRLLGERLQAALETGPAGLPADEPPPHY